MSDSQSDGNGTGPRRRRGTRFLSPSEKYEVWISLIRGEYTIVQAAEQAGVDRSTIMKLRMVARQGALDALAASKPGVRAGSGPDPELAAANAEIARLTEALKEMGVRLMLAEAKGRWDRVAGSRGECRRPPKHRLLELIDAAVADGWDHRRVWAYLELGEGRGWRWRERRAAGTLEDRQPGGHPVHAIMPAEEAAIVRVFETHQDTDRSHRKLAHRGSYEGIVWVSESTVRRVLAAHQLRIRMPRRAGRSERTPFPEWASYERHSIWIYDTIRFARCTSTYVVMIMDLVTRKWITELVSPEETGLQVQLAFTHALELEGLLERVDAHHAQLADPTVDDPARPVLLAVSDNGPQMTSGSTREFLAMCAIAQHFGRPGTPTDQAWIESLFSHIKADWPHLDAIRDPAVLRAELASVRHQYNTQRLHAGIGYFTPDDEHAGRGPAIRAARRTGLYRARRLRVAYNRGKRQDTTCPSRLTAPPRAATDSN